MKANKYAILITFVMAIVMFSGGRAQAAATGLYLGGSLGQATLEDDLSATLDSFKENDTSYKLFGGFRFGLLPVLDIAAEGSYRDFGSPSEKIGGQKFEIEVTGYDLSALVIFPIGPIDIYLKGGGLRYSLDASFAGLKDSEDGNAAIYGTGIGARFWKLGFRAEYEMVDIDELDKAYMYWASIYYMF